MGTVFHDISVYHELAPSREVGSVLELALRSVRPLLERHPAEDVGNMVVATSGPDTLAPSLGQELRKSLSLSTGSSYDLIQGCAGGCAALILGSHLAAASNKTSLVIAADLSLSSMSVRNPLRDNFANASFAVLIRPVAGSEQGLKFERTVQFPEFTDIVSIPLGHKTRALLGPILRDPSVRDLDEAVDVLGFQVKNELVTGMAKKASRFVTENGIHELCPDLTLMHHPNPKISEYMRRIEDISSLNVLDLSRFKNCGAATIGMGLADKFSELKGKRVLMSSFGTGGIVSCGLWHC